MGRAGLVGDEAGSSIIAARLVRDIMRLAFLMERVYPPYPKWFGRAFADLDSADALQPILHDILHAPGWQERDSGLAVAYRHLAEMHNALGVTPPLASDPTLFFGRPFTVIHGDRFAAALRNAIVDPWVKSLASRPLIGNIDLFSDSTDLLENTGRRTALHELFVPSGARNDAKVPTSPNPKQPSWAEEIRALEERHLRPENRRSPADMDALLADTFLEFGSSGVVVSDKPELIEWMRTTPTPPMRMSGFHAELLAPDVVLATYRIAVHGEAGDDSCVRHSLRSSVWQRRDGRWQMVFHQGTPTGTPGNGKTRR